MLVIVIKLVPIVGVMMMMTSNDIDFDNDHGNYTVVRMIIINSLTRNENNIPIS